MLIEIFNNFKLTLDIGLNRKKDTPMAFVAC